MVKENQSPRAEHRATGVFSLELGAEIALAFLTVLATLGELDRLRLVVEFGGHGDGPRGGAKLASSRLRHREPMYGRARTAPGNRKTARTLAH